MCIFIGNLKPIKYKFHLGPTSPSESENGTTCDMARVTGAAGQPLQEVQLRHGRVTGMQSTFWIPSTQDDSSVVRVGFDCVNHFLQLIYSLIWIICRIGKKNTSHVNHSIPWEGLGGHRPHCPPTASPGAVTRQPMNNTNVLYFVGLYWVLAPRSVLWNHNNVYFLPT